MGQEQAIHQLTGVLAEGWGISDRGILRVGMAADMNLINMVKLHNEQQQYVDDMPGGARRYTREARGFDVGERLQGAGGGCVHPVACGLRPRHLSAELGSTAELC